ncbi:MATE family efflux transporter [Psychromonas sp. Urea-02u-13]|uniref:MATE family efflux transporter n=1 Tax=Psychromonas sp. Urea-02u-13 TaxID=2058326 RepID=UPI000C32EDA2|nr:MATE family efflux transporter [Psychromonas sp. Urea-02u-13]PKG38990.1 MATE family efflux transporter [Psychromonas sp. Urea-02u-13]
MKNKIATFRAPDFQNKLWQLALPITFQSLLYSFLGLVDILMVSQLGESEIAAVGLGNKIFFFNLLIMVGISHAGGVLAAQYFGANDLSGLRRSLVLSLLFSIVSVIPFIALYVLMPETITGLATDDLNLLALANDYLIITAYSFIFTAVVLPLETALRSAGDTKTAMNISILVLPINALLNYIFIFGHLGFPEMGVAGSAWGTLIARFIQMLLMIVFVIKKRPFIIAKLAEAKQALSYFEIKRYTKLALPMVLHDGGWALGVLVYTLIFAMIGMQELAVMSMVSTIEQTIFALFIGIAIASGTMIGHQLGAKAFDEAWQQAWTFILFVPILAFIFTPIIIILREPILSLFPSLSLEAMSSASQVLLVLALVLFVRVINFIGIIGVLRSGGDVNYSTFIDIFCMWCVGIPLTFIAVKYYHFTLVEAYIVMLSEELIKVLLVIHRVHKKHWLRNMLNN